MTRKRQSRSPAGLAQNCFRGLDSVSGRNSRAATAVSRIRRARPAHLVYLVVRKFTKWSSFVYTSVRRSLGGMRLPRYTFGCPVHLVSRLRRIYAAMIEYGRAGGQKLAARCAYPGGRGTVPSPIVVHGGGWAAVDRRWNVEPLFGPVCPTGWRRKWRCLAPP